MGNNIVYRYSKRNIKIFNISLHTAYRDTYVTINELTFNDYKHDQTKKIIMYYYIIIQFRYIIHSPNNYYGESLRDLEYLYVAQ